VMAHIGLTPQSVHALSGYRVQGRGDEAAGRLLADAKALQDAGAFSVVLEVVPFDLAKKITHELHIPTIGIGAGVDCDGQVLVSYDMLGMDESFKPRFVRRFATLGTEIKNAVGQYVTEVRGGTFPSDAEAFAVTEKQAAQTPLYSTIKK